MTKTRSRTKARPRSPQPVKPPRWVDRAVGQWLVEAGLAELAELESVVVRYTVSAEHITADVTVVFVLSRERCAVRLRITRFEKPPRTVIFVMSDPVKV